MTSRATDPLGKIRYAPLAAMPLGVAALLVMLYGTNHHAREWVLTGALLTVVWAAIEIALSVRILQRLRAAKATRSAPS